MSADLLIKGLPPKVYHEHVTHMGVVYIDDQYSRSLYLDFVFVFLMCYYVCVIYTNLNFKDYCI